MNKLADITVKMAELAHWRDSGYFVEDHQFTRCKIVGPAVLVIQDGIELVWNSFQGSPERILWDVRNTRVIGGIGVRNCRFDTCEFEEIGMAGSPSFREAFVAGTQKADTEPSTSPRRHLWWFWK